MRGHDDEHDTPEATMTSTEREENAYTRDLHSYTGPLRHARPVLKPLHAQGLWFPVR